MAGKTEGKGGFDVEAFWKNMEEEIGEKIILRSLGQYVEGYEDWGAPCWGLFFLTDSALHFKHFRQENWFSTMLTATGKARGDEDRAFRIPRSAITEISRRRAVPALLRFFLRSDPEAVLSYRASDGSEQNLSIRVEQEPNRFYSLLEQA